MQRAQAQQESACRKVQNRANGIAGNAGLAERQARANRKPPEILPAYRALSARDTGKRSAALALISARTAPSSQSSTPTSSRFR